MEINYIPTKQDLLDTGRTGLKSKRIIYFLFVGVFYVLPAIILIVHLFIVRPLDFVSIGTMIIIPIVMYYLMRRFMLQNLNSPSLKGNHRYILDEETIELSGPGFDNNLQWSLIDSCVRSNTTYLFHSGKCAVLSIPLRALNALQREQLDEILTSKSL